MNDWDRVIAAVVIRRSELGLTQRDLAAKAGVAERTVQNLEAGTRPQPLIRGKIERALGWPTGEMERIAKAPADTSDVLADEFGEENAARLRRVLGKRGQTGADVLRAIENELRAPREDGTQGESGRSRAAS